MHIATVLILYLATFFTILHMKRYVLDAIRKEASEALPTLRLHQTFKFNFSGSLNEFEPELRSKFIVNEVDEEMKAFFDNCEPSSMRFFKHWVDSIAKACLAPWLSKTTINGLLNRGRMFVLSSQQFRALLQRGHPEGHLPVRAQGTLLDIGAGDGGVTAKLATMFSRIYATEFSKVMRWRLVMRGYTLLGVDDWQAVPPSDANTEEDVRVIIEPRRQYDVISCLNVLDRCERPITMLELMRDSLVPYSGRIIIALVLPYKPFVENDDGTYGKPLEYLEIEGSSWEENVVSLVENVFEPLDLHVEGFSRAPYLCEGDVVKPYYVLRDTMFCLSHRPTSASSSA